MTAKRSKYPIEKLIKSRIKNFLGHGNLKSDTWFICMEEGHDGTFDDVRRKFLRTHGKKIFDPRPCERWFGRKARIQPTWGKLIRILLATEHSKKIAMDKEQVRAFQINHFGKERANHTIMELMSLPCFSVNKWIYSNVNVQNLENRKAYERRYRPERIKLFKALIAKHRPKAVVLCSFSHLRSVWPAIAGGMFHEIYLQKNKIYHRMGGRTHYFVIPHPTARQSLSNKFWFKVGRVIRRITKSYRMQR